MILNARHSDHTSERVLHVAVPVLIGAAAAACALYLTSVFLVVAAISVCAAGVFAALPAVWQLPTAFLGGAGAAAGIALINSFGNLSGFAGPYVQGWMEDLTGSFRAGLWIVAGFMCSPLSWSWSSATERRASRSRWTWRSPRTRTRSPRTDIRGQRTRPVSAATA
jgi:MFS transporter, ACS family, tartrate transporter